MNLPFEICVCESRYGVLKSSPSPLLDFEKLVVNCSTFGWRKASTQPLIFALVQVAERPTFVQIPAQLSPILYKLNSVPDALFLGNRSIQALFLRIQKQKNLSNGRLFFAKFLLSQKHFQLRQNHVENGSQNPLFYDQKMEQFEPLLPTRIGFSFLLDKSQKFASNNRLAAVLGAVEDKNLVLSNGVKP